VLSIETILQGCGIVSGNGGTGAGFARAEALASLEELQGRDHHLSLCRVLWYGIARITPMTGDFETAEQAIAHLIAVAAALNAPFWTTTGRLLEGKLMIERGEFATGLAALRGAFEICSRTGWRISYPEFRGALASAFAGLFQLGEALEAVNEGIASAGQGKSGQRWYVPELIRIKGEVLLQQEPSRFASAAEDCFHQAAEIAREQGALFWELRVALSVARLRMGQGRCDEARQSLAPVYNQFTEGFNTTDLRAARSMLDLSPP
jgi:predicted ATPase